MKANQLNWKALGFSLGIYSGAYLALSALIAMSGISLAGFSRETFDILRGIFPMLTATWGGVFAGLGIGLLCGTVCGSIIGWLYNLFLSLPRNLSFGDRLGRAVLGAILIFAGDYAGGVAGGIIIMGGGIALAEAIFGYCYLVQLLKK